MATTRSRSASARPARSPHQGSAGHLEKADAPPCGSSPSSAARPGSCRWAPSSRSGTCSRRARRLRSPASRRARASRDDQAAQLLPRPRIAWLSQRARARIDRRSATPSRVFKGIRGPGQMGNERVTQRGLEVVRRTARREPGSAARIGPGPKGVLRRDQERRLMAGRRPRTSARKHGKVALMSGLRRVSSTSRCARGGARRAERSRRGTASTLRGEVGDDRRKGVASEGHRRRPRGALSAPASHRWRRGVQTQARGDTVKVNRKERRRALRLRCRRRRPREPRRGDPASWSRPRRRRLRSSPARRRRRALVVLVTARRNAVLLVRNIAGVKVCTRRTWAWPT